MSNFGDFTLATPLLTDFVVGYRTAVAGGERRQTLSSVLTLFKANTTAGDIGAATAAQGALADTALQPSAIGATVQGYSAILAAVAGGTYTGDDSIVTVGTIGAGTWQGTAIATGFGGMLAGGSTGQILRKASNTNYDLEWAAAGGVGTVTSVDMSVPSFLAVAGNPITTSGTLAVTLATQAANIVFAGPTNGAAAAPTFRSLVAADIPSLAGVYQPLDAALTALAGGSDFVQFTGPASTVKAFTLPNAAATILTDNAVVTVGQGGTGLGASYTVGDLLYASAAGTLSKRAAVAAGAVFVSAGTAQPPQWSTTPTISGTITASGNTDSSSTTTGTIITAGGLGVAKKIFVGDLVTVTGSTGAQRIYMSGTTTGGGATTAYGILDEGVVGSGITTAYNAFMASPDTAAATFTLTDLRMFNASMGALGSGSAVTNVTGFYANSDLTVGTNNYGFRGAIAAASNTYNLYMDGSAQNFLSGNTGVGTTPASTAKLLIGGPLSSPLTFGFFHSGTIQSTITSAWTCFQSQPNTAASSFTLADLAHFVAAQGTIGSGSAVTVQTGFLSASSMTGATTNYGFRGLIASGSNRWNLYMDGTAANLFAGITTVSNATDASSTTTGALIVTGGVGIAKKLYVGDDVVFADSVFRLSAFGAGMLVTDSSGNVTSVAINPAYTTGTPTTTYTWTASATAAVQNLSLTLGGNLVLSMSGWTNGMTGVAIMKQDGTGSRTLTLPASSKVGAAGAGAITLTTTANAIDILTVAYDGTNYFWNRVLNFT